MNNQLKYSIHIRSFIRITIWKGLYQSVSPDETEPSSKSAGFGKLSKISNSDHGFYEVCEFRPIALLVPFVLCVAANVAMTEWAVDSRILTLVTAVEGFCGYSPSCLI